MPGRRIERKISRTAELTCASRATSFLESDHHYRSDDHIALLLVPTFIKYLLNFAWLRRYFSRVIAPKGIYEYTISRTKYIDTVFREVLAESFDQILIFGAGFDTRALRFQTQAGNTTFFELDVSITQQAKLEQYKKRRLSVPANVKFISIDFDKESLPGKLEEAGFDKLGRSLFVLEGLLMYLQPESVDNTFKVIDRFSGAGSEVVFDYVRASVLLQPNESAEAKEILRTMTKAGEQWYFGIEEGELGRFLQQYGLRVIEHKDVRELERMYFTNDSGQVVGRVNDTHRLVRAVKVERA